MADRCLILGIASPSQILFAVWLLAGQQGLASGARGLQPCSLLGRGDELYLGEA